MSYNIDSIRRKVILEAPETVSTTWASDSWSLDNRFGPFSIVTRYANGNGAVNMSVYFQVSNTQEDADFTDIVETRVNLTDDSGVINYDVDGTGFLFGRIKIVVTAGTLDVTLISYAGQQAH